MPTGQVYGHAMNAYPDKQVTAKARHNSHDEVPYEKRKVLPNYPGNYEIVY